MAAQAATDPIPPRVIIANISRGQLSMNMVAGVIQSMQADLVHGFVMAESGPYLDAGRNRAVANCLAHPEDAWEWLLFVDSDVEFTPEHIARLFEPYQGDHGLRTSTYPVIAGIYCNPFTDEVPGEEEGADHIGPVVYEWVAVTNLQGELEGIPTETFRRLSRKSLAAIPPMTHHHADGWDSTYDDLARVAAVGTGFMAIHRTLLREMEARYAQPLPWFEEPVRNGVHYGEDMGFCLRLMDMGYPVLVHRGVTPLHHKTIKLI